MAKASINRRGATPVDAHIGQKIRTRRNLLGLTQTELADSAGITFQQVQKYEKGTNRVGASRLQQFSEALGVPPSYFFEGLPAVGKKQPAPQEGELSEETIVSFLELAKAPLLSGRSWQSNKSQFAKALLPFLRL